MLGCGLSKDLSTGLSEDLFEGLSEGLSEDRFEGLSERITGRPVGGLLGTEPGSRFLSRT